MTRDCIGDQPQLREDAVLAADEQAGAPRRGAVGRQCSRATSADRIAKAIVPVGDIA